ncbi:MAG: J domain-containing protein [Candidatus Ancillula sp.]|nr:J domain-containing protein [Candidatus Ancillula sp.]
MKDYYAILGVSKSASDSEIKKAYRKRARELHPDVAGNAPENEEQFKEISAAYEVLGHADKRALYDQGVDPLSPNSGNPFGGSFNFSQDMFSDIFDMFAGGRSQASGQRRSRTQRGDDILVHERITLEESISGVDREVSVSKAIKCKKCQGSGSESGSGEVTCPTCRGQGVVQHVSRSLFGQMVQQSVCPDCQGVGTQISDPCTDCNGLGVQMSSDKIEFNLPPGVRNNHRIRFTGLGNAGRNNGPSGDFYVEVGVKDDPIYEVSGSDLVCKLSVHVTTALLGKDVEVETFDGSQTVNIPPGASSGMVIAMPDLGLPVNVGEKSKRGDLKVFIEVVMPSKISAKQRKIIEELSREFKDDKQDFKLANLHEGGFFSWVKKFF